MEEYVYKGLVPANKLINPAQMELENKACTIKPVHV
jgi:hypothetical protein